MAFIYSLSRRRREVCKGITLGDLTDNAILQATRFPRSAVVELSRWIADDLVRPTARSNALSAETQLLAALHFYATGSFQWMVGRSCGLSQSSVSHCINDVTDALVKLAPTFITFPTDHITLRANKQSFHAVAHFPNVIGAIDCTHIPIKAPSANEEAFVNRKGVHTINVQAVCDADMRLLNVVAKWPGSSHDSFIWRSSSLRALFESGHIQGGWLVGELGLLLTKFITTCRHLVDTV